MRNYYFYFRQQSLIWHEVFHRKFKFYSIDKLSIFKYDFFLSFKVRSEYLFPETLCYPADFCQTSSISSLRDVELNNRRDR
jgi:hypothetical protein